MSKFSLQSNRAYDLANFNMKYIKEISDYISNAEENSNITPRMDPYIDVEIYLDDNSFKVFNDIFKNKPKGVGELERNKKGAYSPPRAYLQNSVRIMTKEFSGDVIYDIIDKLVKGCKKQGIKDAGISFKSFCLAVPEPDEPELFGEEWVLYHILNPYWQKIFERKHEVFVENELDR